MPTYDYRCASCEQHLEIVQSMTDDPIEVCAACGGRMQKVLHPVGIVLKGSGFYRTDSRSAVKPKAKGAGEDTGAAKTEGSGESAGKTDKAKDAGKSESKKPATTKGTEAKSA